MPSMDGHTVIARLRENPAAAAIPENFITALAEEETGFTLDAVDYIAKPIKPATVLARARTPLEQKQARDRLAGRNAALEKQVAQRGRRSASDCRAHGSGCRRNPGCLYRSPVA